MVGACLLLLLFELLVGLPAVLPVDFKLAALLPKDHAECNTEDGAFFVSTNFMNGHTQVNVTPYTAYGRQERSAD